MSIEDQENQESAENVDTSENQAKSEEIVEFIIEQLKQGASPGFIVQKLTSTGLSADDATTMVNEIKAEVEAIAEQEALTPPLLITAAIGALIASAIGGFLWALIVITTGYEIGYVAVAVGFLSGYAVVFFAKGKKGIPLQVIASLSSLFGIFLGNYYMYQQQLKDYQLANYGQESADAASLLNPEVMSYFIQDLSGWVTPYDLLWVGIAMYMAWQIPQGSGFKLGS